MSGRSLKQDTRSSNHRPDAGLHMEGQLMEACPSRYCDEVCECTLLLMWPSPYAQPSTYCILGWVIRNSVYPRMYTYIWICDY